MSSYSEQPSFETVNDYLTLIFNVFACSVIGFIPMEYENLTQIDVETQLIILFPMCWVSSSKNKKRAYSVPACTLERVHQFN